MLTELCVDYTSSPTSAQFGLILFKFHSIREEAGVDFLQPVPEPKESLVELAKYLDYSFQEEFSSPLYDRFRVSELTRFWAKLEAEARRW